MSRKQSLEEMEVEDEWDLVDERDGEEDIVREEG